MARTATAARSSKLIQAAAVVALIFAVHFAAEVLLPVALAILFSFLLTPLVDRLERWKLPRVPAVLLVIVFTFAALGGLGWMVARQVEDLANRLPQYRETLANKYASFESWTRGSFSKIKTEVGQITHKGTATQPATRPAPELPHVPFLSMPKILQPPAAATQPSPNGPFPVYSVPAPGDQTTALRVLSESVGPALAIAATAFVVIVLAIFMLIRREDVRDRLIRLVSHGHLTVTTQAMTDAAGRVSKYLLMLAIVNGIYGLGVGLGLWGIGLAFGGEQGGFPNAPLWGLLAALFRFIPYAGPWIGASIPFILSLAIYPGMHLPLMTLGLFVVLELMTNGWLEPWLYGTHTGVSPIALLAATVFWTWVWGPVGLILATPLTVVMVVMGTYVPQLEFLSVMLGDAPVFPPRIRFYQRLLAADPEEASEVVEEYLEHNPLDQCYETVMIPALKMTEEDRSRGRLDDQRRTYVLETMKDLVEELGERLHAGALPTPTPEEKKAVATPLGPVAPTSGAEAAPKGTVTVGAAPADAAATGGAAAPAATLDYRTLHPAVGGAAAVPVRRIAGAEKLRVMCLPARDEADEVTSLMFAQVLEIAGFNVLSASVTALASEMVEQVVQKQADLVVIGALPPSAVTHSRYLCKRLHGRLPDLNVLVGLWHARGDLKRSERRIACATTDKAAATFGEALEQLSQLVPTLLLNRDRQAESQAGSAKESTRQPAAAAVIGPAAT